jgi:hypothetical protein
MTTGGAKKYSSISVQYANERKQFGKTIASFGAIKYKLAEQAIRIFVSESATMRTSGLINDKEHELLESGKSYSESMIGAAEEYAIEAAMLKVFGSEVLDYIVDETVQIHGGYGYSEEYPAARGYRDSRINRIFEGTNEINRLLTVDMLIKRSMKGRINLMGPAMAIQKELMSIPEFGEAPTGVLAAELDAIRNAKKAILMTAGMAVQKFMQKLADEQEIIMDLTDMLIEVYTSESAILRTQKLATMKNEDELQPYIEMTQAYVSDSLERINLYGKHAISAFAEGDELKLLTLGLKRFTKFGLINTTKLRRNIADRLIAANKYCF